MNRTPTNLTTCLACAVAAFMALSLSACGQKGDLYLPDRSARYSSPLAP